MTKEDRVKVFVETWKNYTDEENDGMVINNIKFMKYLSDDGFFDSPASTKYHGSYEGGLFDHSLTVFKRLAELTKNNKLEWQRKESPFIVGMFHDLCKCDQYIKADGARTEAKDVFIYGDGLFHYEYNDNTLIKGHGSKSVIILSQFINLTEEEMLCIRYHMGAYEQDDWAEFDKAIRKYPNVLWTHHSDMIASKIDNT